MPKPISPLSKYFDIVEKTNPLQPDNDRYVILFSPNNTKNYFLKKMTIFSRQILDTPDTTYDNISQIPIEDAYKGIIIYFLINGKVKKLETPNEKYEIVQGLLEDFIIRLNDRYFIQNFELNTKIFNTDELSILVKNTTDNFVLQSLTIHIEGYVEYI